MNTYEITLHKPWVWHYVEGANAIRVTVPSLDMAKDIAKLVCEDKKYSISEVVETTHEVYTNQIKLIGKEAQSHD